MKKSILFIILILSLLTTNKVVYAEKETATYGVDSDFPPYSYIVDGKPFGFESDLIKLIFSSETYNLDMQLGYTWDEIYKNTKSGNLDICGTIVKTDTRAKEVLYTADVYTRYFGVFTNENSDTLDYDHLEKYKLGAVKGYYSETIVKDEIKSQAYKIYETYELMIYGLLNNEIDAFIETTNVVKYYIEKNNLIGYIILGKDGLFPLSVPFGVNKERSDLVDFINLRLKALKASGEYEFLYMKTFSSHSTYYYEQQNRKFLILFIGFVVLSLLILFLIHIYIRFLRKKIIKEQGYSKVIVNNATAMILLYSPENGLESFNPYASKLTGYDEIEVLGAQWASILFQTDNHSDHLKRWIMSHNNHPSNTRINNDETLQMVMRCKNGTLITLLLRCAKIDLPHDTTEKYVIFGTDITEILASKEKLKESYLSLEISTAELEEINAEYEASIDELEREVDFRKTIELDLIEAKRNSDTENHAKGNFLANMSHEIRTPMNGFIGMIQLLNMTPLSKEQIDYLKVMETSSKALLVIVNQIMDYSKIESGKMELENKPFNLIQLLSEMEALFYPSAYSKSLNIKIDIDNNLSPQLIGDSFKLKQILSNLLSNAIKFTNQGSVGLSVKSRKILSKEKILLEFQICDSGIGIPEDKTPLLFNRFTQLDSSHTRKHGGSGLGLAISKGLVELMGGAIWAESVPGEGSCFSFTCEMSQIPLSDDHTIKESHPISSFRLPVKLNVLLVEDDLTSQLIIKTLFSKNGWSLTVANNGEEALETIKHMTFDLILMDCQMPVMDGFKTTQSIRALEGLFMRTPIIAMTAHTLPGDYNKCIEAGMDSYISKPINFNELMTLIDALFKTGQSI